MRTTIILAAACCALIGTIALFGCNQDPASPGKQDSGQPATTVTRDHHGPGDRIDKDDPIGGGMDPIDPVPDCEECPARVDFEQNADGSAQLYFGGIPGTALDGRIKVTITISDVEAGKCEGDPPDCPKNCKATFTFNIRNNRTTTPFTYKWSGQTRTVQPGYSRTESFTVDEPCSTKVDLPMKTSSNRQFWLKGSNGKKYKLGCEKCKHTEAEVEVRNLFY